MRPEKSDAAYYSIFKTKDARFDGRFFVGVTSTGIYCRPVCRAKLPKPSNCTYHETAAAAECAGFRPCLLCRPELAPGTAPASLAQRAARMLEESCGGEEGIGEIASRLGFTDRHLRRAFAAEYNVSPVEYLQTSRLLLAKNLLTDTRLSVLDVAMAAGFGSLRRFNDLFRKRYRLSPSALRKEAANKIHDENITLALGYRPPYPWEKMLGFLAHRAIPGVEAARGDVYSRTVRLPGAAPGKLRIGHNEENNTLSVTVDSALLPVLPQVLGRVRHLFDLHCDPGAVHEVLEPMNRIRPGLAVLGTRVPGCFDPFEMAVRAVLGQQITVKAARTLAARIVQKFGVPLHAEQTDADVLTHVFPSPEEIARLPGSIGDHLGPLGVTGARAKTIRAMAAALADGDLDLRPGADPEREMKRLQAIPGIGPWTAHYIAMRALAWPDAFPHTDYGVRKALEPRTDKEILSAAEAWRPWRSYATMNLWMSI